MAKGIHVFEILMTGELRSKREDLKGDGVRRQYWHLKNVRPRISDADAGNQAGSWPAIDPPQPL